MFEVKRIETEEEAAAALRAQNPSDRLPEFLFHDPRYKGVVLEFVEDGRQAGLSFGVTARGDPRFYLHHFSLDGKHSGTETVLWFLAALFARLRVEFRLRKVIVSMQEEKAIEPPFLLFLRKLHSCSLERVDHIRQMGMKTRDFAYLKQFRWYCPNLLKEKGCEAVLWKEYDKKQIQKIRKAEFCNQTEEDYLSPGIWEKGWEYDEKTSFVLVQRGTKGPLGWIVTEKMNGEGALKIRRFYIYKAARRKMLGPAFATWVLDVIAQYYDELYYDVVLGNRQMEMFTDCYCKPVLAFSHMRCNITVEI